MSLLMLLWMTSLAADPLLVHRCVGADQVVRYQDEPCDAGEVSAAMQLAAPAAITAAPPATEPEPEPAPAISAQPPATAVVAPRSWRCEVENGEVFYRHDGCPDSLSDPQVLIAPDGSAMAYPRTLWVRAESIDRASACRAIGRSGRLGSERDQRAQPYEKLSGRDLCR